MIFDPDEETTISAQTHHMNVDYSMFEGMRVKGVPQAVISRGRVIVENGEYLGSPGDGGFLERGTQR